MLLTWVWNESGVLAYLTALSQNPRWEQDDQNVHGPHHLWPVMWGLWMLSCVKSLGVNFNTKCLCDSAINLIGFKLCWPHKCIINRFSRLMVNGIIRSDIAQQWSYRYRCNSLLQWILGEAIKPELETFWNGILLGTRLKTLTST